MHRSCWQRQLATIRTQTQTGTEAIRSISWLPKRKRLVSAFSKTPKSYAWKGTGTIIAGWLLRREKTDVSHYRRIGSSMRQAPPGFQNRFWIYAAAIHHSERIHQQSFHILKRFLTGWTH